MIDANEYYLNQHLKEQGDADKREEWIEQQVEVLMSEGQDCYPFSPDNVHEAICEMDQPTINLLSFYCKGASTFQNAGSLCLSDFLIEAIKIYWKQIAEVKADINFSERD